MQERKWESKKKEKNKEKERGGIKKGERDREKKKEGKKEGKEGRKEREINDFGYKTLLQAGRLAWIDISPLPISSCYFFLYTEGS